MVNKVKQLTLVKSRGKRCAALFSYVPRRSIWVTCKCFYHLVSKGSWIRWLETFASAVAALSSILVTALAAVCSRPGCRQNVLDSMALLHSPKPKLNHGLCLILPSWTVEENIRNCRRASAELTPVPFNSSREESSVLQGPCQVTESSTST